MKIAYNYAYSLIDYSKDKEILDDFKIFIDLLNSNPDFYKLLNITTISKEEKKKMIDKTFPLNSIFISFIKVLIDNNRFILINEIYDEYEKLFYEMNDIVKVTIKSALKLEENEINKINLYFKEKLNKKIIIENIIDNKIIDGYVINYNGNILDNSVINRLFDMKNAIM